MPKKPHFVLSVTAACLVATFLAAPFVARGDTNICAPDDTMTGCTCNANGYSPDALVGAGSTAPPAGTVEPGDYIVSTEVAPVAE